MTNKNLPRRITSNMLFDNSLHDLFNFFDSTPAFGLSKSLPNYPHFNITDVYGDDVYDVEVALAGFDKDDITVQFEPYNKSGYTAGNVKVLAIRALHEHSDESEKNYLHQGLAKRDAKLSLVVGKDDEVLTCKYENGILKITLKKVRPHSQDVHTIDIE